MRKPSLMIWMVLTICAVAVAAFWDEQREFTAALGDFAGEQTALARAVAAALRSSLLAGEAPAQSSPGAVKRGLELALGTTEFLAAVRSVERPGAVRLLLQSPGGTELTTSNGTPVRALAIERGFASGATSVRLSRSEAHALGLPARMAMAGLTTLPGRDPAGRWGIAVVASAQRERDRERNAEWRLALSVLVASGLVLAFGGVAVRTQRKEMSLSHELRVASMQSARDERLVRADKLATMGALATGIAHEVSTPLGVILGRAEQLLPKLNGDQRSRRAVEAIVEQAERIGGIIRDFLALARGDSPSMKNVPPARIAEVALELVQHRFAKAGVSLNSELARDLPEIACEPRLIEQVMVNLLLNACDACRRGGHVEFQVLAQGQRVAFVVTDDGAGISESAAARILDPFFTTKPAGEGSGLGLAIANELVKHHRGTLSIAPRQDQAGTCACVEFPSTKESLVG